MQIWVKFSKSLTSRITGKNKKEVLLGIMSHKLLEKLQVAYLNKQVAEAM